MVLALVLGAAAACSDMHGWGGSTLQSVPFVGPTFGGPGFQVAPAPLSLYSVSSFGCPSIQPFGTSLNLVIDARTTGDLFLNQVGFQFADGPEFRGAPVIFAVSQLRPLFGEPVVRGGTTRSFHFSPQFGCDLPRPHSISTSIVVLDGSGSPRQMALMTPVQ
jgi:hypothetical protein